MSKIDRSKVRTSRVQSTALANPTVIGDTIPSGMNRYIIGFRAYSVGAVTTISLYSGITATPKQTTIKDGVPVLASNAVGALDTDIKGDIDHPIAVIRPGRSGGTRSNTNTYVGDGGVRCECEIDYIDDY